MFKFCHLVKHTPVLVTLTQNDKEKNTKNRMQYKRTDISKSQLKIITEDLGVNPIFLYMNLPF